MEEQYKKIIEAAQAGGQVLKHYFGQNLDIEQKTIPADVRTKADTESEEAVLKILKENFPDYNIDAEESDDIENGSEYTFLVDPLDATSNFVIGIPNISVIIALQKNKETIFGVVYQPILDHTYYAQKGKGAYLNGQKITVNDIEETKDVCVGMVWGYVHDKETHTRYLSNLIQSDIKRVSINYSMAIDFCLIASGKMEAVMNNGCHPRDYAAGKLILQEAGGVVTDWEGNLEIDSNSDKFLATNNQMINTQILNILK